jgi:protein O-GlcNAc transferase
MACSKERRRLRFRARRLHDGTGVTLYGATECIVEGDIYAGLSHGPPYPLLWHSPFVLKPQFMATIPESLETALQHHKSGRLSEAEEIYRQILAVQPQHADALHLLGVIAYQVGKHDFAIEYIQRAIGLNGTDARYHSNLGHILKDQERLDEAVACCRRSLELDPDFAEAHNSLGNALKDQGKLGEAVACYRRTLELNPESAAAHYNLGVVLNDQEELDEAVACYRRALGLKPDLAEAHNNLGAILKDQRKFEEAITCCHRALELKPGYSDAHNNLGSILKDQGKLDEAVACYLHAIELAPGFAEAHNNLGTVLRDQGKLDEAIACHRRALELKLDFAEAHYNLGNVLKDQGKGDEAIECYYRALELKPGFVEAHFNLGITLKDQGKLDEAVACYGRILELKPEYAEAHDNLGTVLKDQGKLDEAIACHRRALELKPGFADAHSNLLYTLQFCADQENRRIYAEHLRWSRRYAEPLKRFIQPNSNERSPNRRLRIGYVSADFNKHPVGRFLLPLLESHNHQEFEIFCYASVRSPDSITDLCRTHADVWRNVLDSDDEQLARIVRQDQIDILVDLTMHMANNRLLAFARKPAPVQVTYLAYCGTTGLNTIDYRFTDPYLDPTGQDGECYFERSIRLPETYWCYRPMAGAPEENALPALQGGPVMFGCLNNFAKVTLPTLVAWGRILQAVPNSRLLLHAGVGSHRARVQEILAQQDISPDRVVFTEKVGGTEYFRLYQSIDVALDPFPYGGGTTTCDALWMGVPVVTLVGRTAVGRGGLSILSNIGLVNLVAYDPEQYIRIAVELVQDLPELDRLRGALRNRMQCSPLMDASRFARNIEAAYRSMWQDWCAK